jgi:glycosyltransferase involved in cell wall biosynthesis
MNLVQELVKIDRENEYVVLLRSGYFNQLKFPKNWLKVEADVRHYSFAEQIKIPRLIGEHNPDLIHFPHFNVPVMFRGKFVVTIHDLLMHRQKGLEATTLNPAAYCVKRLAYKTVFGSAVINAREIIVPTKYVAKDLVDHYGIDKKKVVVAYEGVGPVDVIPESRFGRVKRKYGLSSEYFVYTGNAYPHKNLGRAIEALSALNGELEGSKLSRVKFAIVTSRSVFAKRLKVAVARLGMTRDVRILGFVPDRDLWAIYKGSIGFVYPSFSEGFGLPGLEAMASGTLALVSYIDVFREVYEDKALYFNPHDISSIKGAMMDAIQLNESRRKKMIRVGQKFVKRYSWEKMAKETLKVYSLCLNEDGDCL